MILFPGVIFVVHRRNIHQLERFSVLRLEIVLHCTVHPSCDDTDKTFGHPASSSQERHGGWQPTDLHRVCHGTTTAFSPHHLQNCDELRGKRHGLVNFSSPPKFNTRRFPSNSSLLSMRRAHALKDALYLGVPRNFGFTRQQCR